MTRVLLFHGNMGFYIQLHGCLPYHTKTLLEQIDKVLILTQFYANVTGQLKFLTFLFAN